MVESDQMVIIDEEGLHGTIVGRRETGAGTPVTVVVELTNGEQLLIPWDRVARRDSRYVFSGRFSEMERRNAEEGGRVVIPLVAEDVAVSKAARETGRVRVIKTTSEWEETVDEPLAREQVQIERVSINRPVEGPMESRQEGDTLIIPVVEEELVIQKRLLLKEEIRITKQRIEEQRPQTVTLRRQEVDIERVPTQEGGQEPARQR
jgi:uncharacterized protein (TIGR02271 family)